MNIFVTGSGGFLGEQLVYKLVEQGHHVFALYRSGYAKSFDHNTSITPIKGNLLQPENLREPLSKCEAIYHVAAYSNNWAKKPSIFYEVNIGGSLKLFQIAKEVGIQKIVVTSTAGTIGPSRNDKEQVTENQFRNINFFGDYESSKFILDERIQHLVRNGMNIVIVCPTRIFGPGKMDGKGNIISKIFTSYLKGKWRFILGNGSDIGCYAFIEDVVQGHIKAMENGHAGEKYLIGSFNATTKELFEYIDNHTKSSKFMFSLPFFFLSIYAALVRPFAKIFKFDPVITQEWIDKIQRNWATDTSKAQQQIGFVPTSPEIAIGKTIDWIKKEVL